MDFSSAEPYAGNTGPTYPPAPAPGSNGLGLFTLGVSPLGDIPPFNFWLTVVSQYANSPVLTQIIASFDASLDQTQNFDNLYDDWWSIDTSFGAGLDAIGRRVGASRVIQSTEPGGVFGFQESAPTGQPFNQDPFWSANSATQNYPLSDPAFRNLILAKAMANISSGSMRDINKILLTLFPGRGNSYVVEGPSAMEMSYTFDFYLTPVELSIVQNGNVLPKPVGVSATVIVNP